MKYSLFETAIGFCAIGWTAKGIFTFQLPGRNKAETEELLLKSYPTAKNDNPPPEVEDVIGRAKGLMSGQKVDFDDLDLDYGKASPFKKQVSEALRQVKRGQWVTYGDLAKMVGKPRGAQAVGRVMATNQIPLIVPCHRVLAGGRSLGGFSSVGGNETKVRMLAIEGVQLPKEKLGLTYEPEAAVEAIKKINASFKKLVKVVGPLRLIVNPIDSPSHALIKSIVYQQLTGRAASTILKRLKEHFGGHLPSAADFLEVKVETLRKLGLSRRKAEAIIDVARKELAGEIPPLRQLRRLSDDEIIERLTKIKGIGRWSVEMLLIFRLGRKDVWPVHDLGVRKGLSILLGRKDTITPKEALVEAKGWPFYRSAISWYLWRLADIGQLR